MLSKDGSTGRVKEAEKGVPPPAWTFFAHGSEIAGDSGRDSKASWLHSCGAALLMTHSLAKRSQDPCPPAKPTGIC